MSRYINIDPILEWCDRPEVNEPYGIDSVELERKIRQAPSIDIVRCKDCKHVMELRSESSAKEFGQIYECHKGVLNCPKPNNFCSYGERRSK